MTRYSMRSIPAAAAMAIALAFGAQVHAQSTVAPAVNNTNKDITMPAPGTPAMPARTGAGGMAVAPAGSMAGTAATGGMAASGSAAAGSMNTNKAVGATGDGGTTAIPGVMPKDSAQRTANKEHKKSMKAAKRAARQSATTGTNAAGSASATSADSLNNDTKK